MNNTTSQPCRQPLPSPRVLGTPSLRSTVEHPECAGTPALMLEGIARDVTPRKLLSGKPYRHTRYMRVGDVPLNLTHEHEPGWPIAMKLKAGQGYRVQAYACLVPVSQRGELPSDIATRDESGEVKTLTFFAIARDRSPFKDCADRRRSCKGHVALWTDGVMVSTANTVNGNVLIPGQAYKVIIEPTPSAS